MIHHSIIVKSCYEMLRNQSGSTSRSRTTSSKLRWYRKCFGHPFLMTRSLSTRVLRCFHVLVFRTCLSYRLVDATLQSYAHMYNALKAPRKLVWKQQVGTAQLELKYHSGLKKCFDVSLIHATIIMHFHECDVRCLHDLEAATKMPQKLMQQKIMFWINHGIIEEISPGVYRVAPQDPSTESEPVPLDEETLHSHGQQVQDEHSVCYQYIIGLLSNLGELPFIRIHELLKLLIDNVSSRQLSKVLERLCLLQEVEVTAGCYKLRTTARQGKPNGGGFLPAPS